MPLWVRLVERGILIEGFLPDHEVDAQEWRIVASRGGQVLGERRVRLTWVPRFGPDFGDVTHADAVLEEWLPTLAAHMDPPDDQPPVPTFPVDARPERLAVVAIAVNATVEAMPMLGLADMTTVALGIAPDRDPSGVLPISVTDATSDRCLTLVHIAEALKRHGSEVDLGDDRRELVRTALLRHDDATLRHVLSEVLATLAKHPDEPEGTTES